MTVLLTGFPGFLASALLPSILRRTGGPAVCVVQSKYAAMASGRVAELVAADPAFEGRIELVEGDITRPGLALDGRAPAELSEVWHLAAVYDLAVGRDLAVAVNVDGTRHVLDLAEGYPDLERVHYFSTCYVSGRYEGDFGEDDLEVGAPFNNHYEETKHAAEAELRRRMAGGLPATIYRPSIVVGDSRTGETQKYDGPYFVIQWLLRQPRFAVLPLPGNPRATRGNVVPRDFVIDAVAYLSGHPDSRGRTYQLADWHPQTVAEMANVLGEATGRRLIKIPVPRTTAKAAIERVPGVDRLLRIPPEVLDYFAHPTNYLTDHAQSDLTGSGIAPPPFPSYAGRLVDFMRRHPEIGSAAMV